MVSALVNLISSVAYLSCVITLIMSLHGEKTSGVVSVVNFSECLTASFFLAGCAFAGALIYKSIKDIQNLSSN